MRYPLQNGQSVRVDLDASLPTAMPEVPFCARRM